jgi:hypothetical protein
MTPPEPPGRVLVGFQGLSPKGEAGSQKPEAGDKGLSPNLTKPAALCHRW